MGKIIEDVKNDIVFTPEIVADLMCKIAEVNSNSVVIDNAAGSGALLAAALNRNASRIIGVELNDYLFDSMKMRFDVGTFVNGSGLIEYNEIDYSKINVALSNPPYSFKNKGLEFGHYMMDKMSDGRCCILIQENAGSGRGSDVAKEILKNNSLLASIKMSNIFYGQASVQVAIFLFEVGTPHDAERLVKFIDMSNDGFKRTSRKGSEPKDVDCASDRYNEVASIVLNKRPATSYYTKESGLFIEDTITLNGDDWTFSQHKKVDVTPTMDDFEKTVSQYMSFQAKRKFIEVFGDADPYIVAMHLLGKL